MLVSSDIFFFFSWVFILLSSPNVLLCYIKLQTWLISETGHKKKVVCIFNCRFLLTRWRSCIYLVEYLRLGLVKMMVTQHLIGLKAWDQLSVHPNRRMGFQYILRHIGSDDGESLDYNVNTTDRVWWAKNGISRSTQVSLRKKKGNYKSSQQVNWGTKKKKKIT